MAQLQHKGAIIEYSDPHVPTFPQKRDYKFNLNSIEINSAVISSYDCLVIATDHDAWDYQQIRRYSQLIIDCRGRYNDRYNPTIIHA